MRLLIVTQVVDVKHPVLGFFHRWIIEFAKHCEQVHVIALQVGEYDLPKNVFVHSLGKEEDVGKFGYVLRFYKYIWKYRKEYDHVFVHMNAEYVVLAGWLWRLLGKRVGLWYMHKSVDLKLRIAEWITHIIFTATPTSFRLPSKKVKITGHGIDTNLFSPDEGVVRGDHVLSVGRLMPSKRHDLVIEAAAEAGKSVRVVGEGEEREALEELARERGVAVEFLGGLSQEKLVEEYRKAWVFVHTSETGSLDKVVLEALACGCAVVTTNENYVGMPVVVVGPVVSSIFEALKRPAYVSDVDFHTYVKESHSLSQLAPKVFKIYES